MIAEALLPAEFWFLVILIALCALGWILRRLEGDWLEPGGLFVVYWTFNLAFCYVAGPALSVSLPATAWIAAALLCFATGALLSGPVSKRHSDGAESRVAHFVGIRTSIVLCTGLGMLSVPAMLTWSGQSLGAIFSTEGLLAIASDVTVQRYTGEKTPATVSLLLTGTYLGGLLSGTFWASRRRSKRSGDSVIACLPLLSALAYSTITTAKATFILTGFLWLSAFIVTSKAGGLFTIASSQIVKALAAFVVAGVAFTALVALRYGVELDNMIDLVPILQVYATGHVAAFSYWFDTSWHSVDPRFGLTLFAGVADFLKVSPRAGGLFEESLDVGGSGTNVYTAFRVFIEDFGTAGALLFLACCGWLITWAARRARRGGRVSLAVAAFGYFLIAWSPVTSVTIYNSLLLAFALYGAYLAAALRNSPVRTEQTLRAPG